MAAVVAITTSAVKVAEGEDLSTFREVGAALDTAGGSGRGVGNIEGAN